MKWIKEEGKKYMYISIYVFFNKEDLTLPSKTFFPFI